jgi:hypothetical protein
MKTAEIITVLVITLAGCGDPMDANEDNFTIALNQEFKDNPVCFTQDILGSSAVLGKYFDFPVTVSRRSYNYQKLVGHLDQFVEAGLLSAESVSLEARNGFGQPYTGRKYDLTDMGRKYHRTLWGHGRFCYGNRVVKEITQYTMPTEAQGMKASKVKYTYTVEGIPDWAQMDYFRNVVKNAVKSKAEPIEDEAVLYLTNKGWSTEF